MRSGGTNSAASPLPPDPVRMELAFIVGPGRDWMNLWKPTLDALGQILGHARPLVPGALDGRTANLRLHCRVDPSMGNDLLIAIAVKHIPAPHRPA